MVKIRISHIFVIAIAITAFVIVHSTPVRQSPRSPVILIPGNGGNRLEAKVNLARTENFLCTKRSSDYFLLWANPKYFFPYIVNCFVNMMRLVRDPQTGLTSNSPGVDIRVPGWGQTYAVEWLSTYKLGPLSYFNKLVDALVTSRGYQRDKDIRGAPYDFRKAPNEMGGYYADLEKLIEDTYFANGNQSVVLVAHSLGGPLTLHFLQHQQQAWKDKYVKSYVSIGGAYGGSGMTVEVMASGDNFGIPTVSALTVRRHQRTFPSTVYLLPKAPAWSLTDVVAITDKRNYTISDYAAFYRDMGYPEAIAMTDATLHITDPTVGPGVKVHCVMTRSTPTAELFDWRGANFPDAKPKAVEGEGDGTVNWRSLALCPQFARHQSQSVTTKMIEGTNHLGMLSEKRLADYLLQEVL